MHDDRLAFNRRAVRPMLCLSEGWQLIKEEYWLFVGISFVGIMIAVFVPLYIMLGPMMCGIHICLLRRQQGRRVSFEMLFDGFHFFAQSLLGTMLFFIPLAFAIAALYIAFFVALFATVAAAAPQGGQGPPANPEMMLAAVLGIEGVFFAAVIGLDITVGFLAFFLYPLIVDRELTGTQAALLSIRAAFANFWGVLAVVLLEMLLSLLGTALCCVGWAFVLPLPFAMVVIAYRQVFPAEDHLEHLRPEPEPGDDDDDPDAPADTGIQTEPRKGRSESHVKEE